MIQKPPRIYPDDDVVSRMENNLANSIDAVISVLLVSGANFVGIKLFGNKPLDIFHRLGRTPSGWFISDKTTYCDVKRISWTFEKITFESNVDTTVSFWIY